MHLLICVPLFYTGRIPHCPVLGTQDTDRTPPGCLQKEESLGVRFQCSQKIKSRAESEMHKYLLHPTAPAFHSAKEPAGLGMRPAETCCL